MAKSKTRASVADLVAGAGKRPKPEQTKREEEPRGETRTEQPEVEKTVPFRLEIPATLHLEMKLAAAKAGISMRQYIHEAIQAKNECDNA